MFLSEILMRENVVASINQNIDKLLYFIPELKCMMGFQEKESNYNLDLWNRTLLSLFNSEADLDVRLVILLRDIGKPFSYSTRMGKDLKDHAKVSAKMSYDILKRFDFSDEYIQKIVYLIGQHNKRIDNTFIIKDIESARKLYDVQCSDDLPYNPNCFPKRKRYLFGVKEKIKREEIRLFY